MKRQRTPGASTVWSIVVCLIGVSGAVFVGAAHPQDQQSQDQQPIYRASVDLVAVDVQVLDRNGHPVAAISPDKFEVSIAGKRRRVVSADFVKSGAPESVAADRAQTNGPLSDNIWPLGSLSSPGRTFVLAVDMASFGIEDARGVVSAARTFLQELQPNDMVGLYAFPAGPRIDPTLDHAVLARTLDTIVGGRQLAHSHFNLTPSEVVDINAEIIGGGLQRSGPSQLASAGTQLTNSDTPVLQRVQLRECGADSSANNASCVEQIMDEATALGMYYEGQVVESLSQLRGLLGVLKGYPGRKTVVLLSAGMPSSDRPGGRPDVAMAAMDIGRSAAEANSQIYAVHIDSAYLRQFAAETRSADKTLIGRNRDDSVGWGLLDQFAGASGGTLIRDLMGNGEIGFDQVLRETSAYYLLGVEPADADRDGRTRELKVKVNAPGVTIRSREWVSIPKKK